MENLLAKWGDRTVSAGTHRGKRFRDIPAAALRRVSQRCPDRDLYRFARMYAAAEALQDVQPCRPLPALATAQLPLGRLGGLQSWVNRVWVVLTWQRVLVMFLLAAVLSRPHTHFLVARLLTRVMQQLLRYAMSLVIHLVEAVLEELVSQVQGRAGPELLSDPTCPAAQGLGVLGQVVLSSASVFVGAVVAWLSNSPLRPRLRLV